MKKGLITLLSLLLLLTLCACQTAAPAASSAPSAAAPAASSSAPATAPVVIGYACFNAADPFHAKVSTGIQAEAAKRGYELIVVDNEFDAAVAVNNVDDLLARGVDIILESTRDAQGVGLAIKEKCDAAGVPLISIDTAIPDTPLFGTDNVLAGGQAGEFLAEKAIEKWGDDPQIDLVISLEAPTAGITNENRTKLGFIDHLTAKIDIPEDKIVRVQGNTIETGMQQTEDILNANPDAQHILIYGFVDAAGQGAEAAIEKMNMLDKVLLCTVEFTDLAIANFDRGEGNTAWIGAVATTPEKYGYYLFEGLSDYLDKGGEIPDAWYVVSQVATFDNYKEIAAG